MGKTNPLNDTDLAEFIELQKTMPTTEKSWFVEISDINQKTYDLGVVNPNTPKEEPLRSPSKILEEMENLDNETSQILNVVRGLI